MHREDNFHYSVLFTRVDRQEALLNVLNEYFPKGRGFAFAPMKEYWRRSSKDVAVKPLFPGYLFVCTDMNREELHDFIGKYRDRVDAFVSQLGIGADLRAGMNPFENSGNQNDDFPELTPDETQYFDIMLDDSGVQRMSEGYIKDGWAVVVNGPLKGQEDRIFRVNRHERIAYLSYKFRGYMMSAGLELKPEDSFEIT